MTKGLAVLPANVNAEETAATGGAAPPATAANPYAAPGAVPPPPGPYGTGMAPPQFRPDPELDSATGAYPPGVPHRFQKDRSPGALTRQQLRDGLNAALAHAPLGAVRDALGIVGFEPLDAADYAFMAAQSQ